MISASAGSGTRGPQRAVLLFGQSDRRTGIFQPRRGIFGRQDLKKSRRVFPDLEGKTWPLHAAAHR
jgi:hypothetical protein